MGPRDLQAYNFYDGKPISFEFESGITVEGLNVTGIRNLRGELMLIQFTDCTVRYKDETLFRPDMGDFDMAVGKEILSAFAGAADYRSFDLVTHTASSKTIRVSLSEEERQLNAYYKEVRELRQTAGINAAVLERSKVGERLSVIFETVQKQYPNDWLLPLELYELTKDAHVLQYLIQLKQRRPKVSNLIDDGLLLIEKQSIGIN